jgi:hypothetical protein
VPADRYKKASILLYIKALFVRKRTQKRNLTEYLSCDVLMITSKITGKVKLEFIVYEKIQKCFDFINN